jgi:hypothetical protein
MSWRVGSKVPLNVYEGERPVCQCHTPEDAARIVVAMNEWEAWLAADPVTIADEVCSECGGSHGTAAHGYSIGGPAAPQPRSVL